MTSAISCWNGYGLIVDFIYKFGSRALFLSMGVKTKTAPKFVEAKSKVFSWDGDWLNGYRIYKFQPQALIFCVDLESRWPFDIIIMNSRDFMFGWAWAHWVPYLAPSLNFLRGCKIEVGSKNYKHDGQNLMLGWVWAHWGPCL